MKKFAQVISIIFEPFTISFITLILITLRLNVDLPTKLIWFFTAAALWGLPPLLVYLYERRVGKIHDLFITNRLERRDVQLAWFLGSGVFFLTALFSEAPRLLLALSLTFFLVSLLITVVSLYWKASVHMVGVTILVITLLLVYSANFWWFLALLPLVGWARIQLGHHTLSQITLATLVTVVVIYFVFYLFGLATF
jgi:hypothetical protein